MADQVPSNNDNTSDEIDLGQLLQLIKNGLHELGNFLLRVFIYLRKNTLKLIGLVVLGLGISYGLNQIISKKLKTDVIVRPNFDSKSYLYDVVDEISANAKAENEAFFDALNISAKENLEGFKIAVEAIEEDNEVKTDEGVLNEMKYLEVLQNFKEESFVIDILRSELSEKSVLDHKITFTYKDAIKGQVVAEKLMAYINTNKYFDDLKLAYADNAKLRIEKNTQLIIQIDELISNYSKALLAEKQRSGTGVVYMEKENTLNVPSLISMKNVWLKEIEEKRLELVQNKNVLSILNFGKPQEVKKSFFNQTYFMIPSVLVVGFFLLSLFQYLNLKAKEIE